jgi:hypothetical protein
VEQLRVHLGGHEKIVQLINQPPPRSPPAARAALLFANPLYFALLLAADATRPGVGASILAGIAAAPLAFWIGGAWGLPVAGLAGGTLAFLWLRRR